MSQTWRLSITNYVQQTPNRIIHIKLLKTEWKPEKNNLSDYQVTILHPEKQTKHKLEK